MDILNNKMYPFTSKEITPLGWIKDQLQTQLDGLSGHLCDFWPDISDSAWIGGKHDSWERVPYWLDGYIPLVYLLNDENGIKRANFYISNILKRQQEDGWIAPKIDDISKYDVWGIFIILKALLGYAEINKSKKVYTAIYKGLQALDKHLDKYPLFEWAKYRWYECLIPIYSIYKKYKEQWLLDLAHKLHDQGFDFYSYYLNDFPKKKADKGDWRFDNHGVNNVMAIKCYALYGQLTQDKADLKKADLMLKMLNKYHGSVSGQINADECLAGLDPRQGSEVCCIVETMYSLELLTAITGKNIYLNQLEKLAFNSLPSGLTNDMWAHQYDTQTNAPFIKRDETNLWTTNGWESNIYGLEPHFGCCTSNFHQGWPKFVNSALMYKGKTLFVNSYLPLEAKNNKFAAKIHSFYPFDNKVVIEIDAKNDGTVKFNIPLNSSFKVNGQTYNKKGYLALPINSGMNRFDIEISFKPIFVKHAGYYSLMEGPLVYALKVNQEKVQINKDVEYREFPHGDFEYHTNDHLAYSIYDFNLKEVSNKVDTNVSPYRSEKSPKSIFVNCNMLSYKIKGNFVNNSSLIIKENVSKEFIPLGINKLHIGALKLGGKK